MVFFVVAKAVADVRGASQAEFAKGYGAAAAAKIELTVNGFGA